MLNCDECVKKDVCGKINNVNNRIDNLKVNYDIQELINSGIEINMRCKNFLNSNEIHTKIIRGED